MSKEILKETVIRLEKELQLQWERNEEILQKLYQIQDQRDEEFKNSPYCKQLEKEVEIYKGFKKLYEDCNRKRATEHDMNVELRKEIQKLKSEYNKVWSEVSALEVEKIRLEVENKRLKETDSRKQVVRLTNELEKLQLEVLELKKQKGIRIHNERHAGRKPKVTFSERNEIIKDRNNGMTIKSLSLKYGYSVGTIHKLIHENVL